MNELFTPGRVLDRSALTAITGKRDRTVRREIREMRRAGVPILPTAKGYKLAETDAEKAQLLYLYRKRAMDELATYAALRRSFQAEGQQTLDELIEKVAGIE